MSTSAANQAAASGGGRVVSVVDDRGRDASGNFVVGKTVTYQLGSGQTGSVFVPGSPVSADAIRAAVTADAAELAKALNITF